MKRVIRLGDPTSHGGTVVSAASTSIINGKQVARLGDKVTCPLKGHGVATIVEGDPAWLIDGIPVALEGHKTSCGASLISTLPTLGRSHEGSGSGSSAGGMAGLAVAAVVSAVAGANAGAGDSQSTASDRYDQHFLLVND